MKSTFLPMVALLSATHSFVQAPTPTPAPAKPTIIFVHGLWADGSSWSKVIPTLQTQGYNVISVQNPTTSIEDDVAATKRAIAMANGDVILAAHSWGGFVISEVGDDPRVKALVYVAAYASDKGETVPSLSEKAAPTALASYLQSAEGFISLTKEGVDQVFATGLPANEQSIVFATQQPASPNVFKAVAQHAAWRSKPTWYIVAANDKTINPDLERLMAQRANAKTTVLQTGHLAMLAQPQKVLAVIEEAVKETVK
jgi:pimeloyl-ACP methyl ester carboxylesterase